jgi:hypothetical protein
MRYFPLDSDRFEHQFGIRALAAGQPLLEATELYGEEIALKRSSLASNRDHYYQATRGTESVQLEAFEFIADQTPFLANRFNSILDEPVVEGADPPLLAIARHVQEDLLIMSPDAAAGYPLVAGVVCFPSGWCIGDKLGQSLLSIHVPVPEFKSVLNDPTQRLMQRLKPGRPVWRMNWGVRPSGGLDQSPIHAESLNNARLEITSANAGRRCFFRVERQTLARLPLSGHVLFAIHTHQCRLEQLEDRQRQLLLGVIESCPKETLAYKGILPMREAIRGCLAGA